MEFLHHFPLKNCIFRNWGYFIATQNIQYVALFPKEPLDLWVLLSSPSDELPLTDPQLTNIHTIESNQ